MNGHGPGGPPGGGRGGFGGFGGFGPGMGAPRGNPRSVFPRPSSGSAVGSGSVSPGLTILDAITDLKFNIKRCKIYGDKKGYITGGINFTFREKSQKNKMEFAIARIGEEKKKLEQEHAQGKISDPAFADAMDELIDQEIAITEKYYIFLRDCHYISDEQCQESINDFINSVRPGRGRTR